MLTADPQTGLGRIKELWWPGYLELVDQVGLSTALDRLDECMVAAQNNFMELAAQFANGRGQEIGSDPFRIAVNQFVKSNLGKMFERFCGVALAYALERADGRYCVQPFRNRELAQCKGLHKNDFRVEVKFGKKSEDRKLQTPIDADLFAYNPTNDEDDIFLISVKSTLKDRFHNVPFWNLLRRAAVSRDLHDIRAVDISLLEKVKYIAVCSDIAVEQPDFGTDAGARNLLQIDAALLDCAYVTSSRARGLPDDCVAQLSEVRQHAFYRYSCFFDRLK